MSLLIQNNNSLVAALQETNPVVINLPSAVDMSAVALAAAADAVAAAASINIQRVADTTALAALDETQWLATITAAGVSYLFDSSDYSTEITDLDPRYVAPASDTSGASGAWVIAGSVWNGAYSKSEGLVPHRLAGRAFGGAAAGYGGEWTVPSGMTGLDPLARALHNWAFRDGGFIWDDVAGAMSIVGHSQSSKEVEWPGSPSFNPATIGVSGFAINDQPAGFNSAWGGYFDAVRLNSGFTVGVEISQANASTEGTDPNPYNVKAGGAQNGVTAWLATGCGLDVVWPEYDLVKDSSAYIALLPSFRSTGGTVAWANDQAYVVGRVANDGATQYVCLVANTAPSSGTFAAYRAANPTHWQVLKTGNWATATAYVVGDLATDTISLNTFRCTTAHTSSGSVFSSYRASNPTHWKQLPGAKAGIVIANGAVTENADGSDLHFGIQMPDRHMVGWYRDEAGTPVLSSFIWATRATDGSATTGITFETNLINFTASLGIRADAARIGGDSNYTTFSRASGANDSLLITNPGTGVIFFSLNGAETGRFDTASLNLATGKTIRINSQQIVGARKTGWALPTGTATRTTFDTATVTTAQLAERVNALIADFHSTAGHGLIGT